MPPSPLSAICEPCQQIYLYQMAGLSHSRPLTPALSPGRGNRFVDADSMLQLYDSLKLLRGASSITTSHIFKPRDFPNPKP